MLSLKALFKLMAFAFLIVASGAVALSLKGGPASPLPPNPLGVNSLAGRHAIPMQMRVNAEATSFLECRVHPAYASIWPFGQTQFGQCLPTNRLARWDSTPPAGMVMLLPDRSRGQPSIRPRSWYWASRTTPTFPRLEFELAGAVMGHQAKQTQSMHYEFSARANGAVDLRGGWAIGCGTQPVTEAHVVVEQGTCPGASCAAVGTISAARAADWCYLLVRGLDLSDPNNPALGDPTLWSAPVFLE